MAIEFDCPNCQHHYRLKDDLAGKTATCKSCRQKIVIPQPVTIPDDPPVVDMEAAEAAALAALTDEPAKVEEDAASKVLDVECLGCGHKWTEPWARAGKNALCPECKMRVKIPELKKDQVGDWRVAGTNRPSLAKPVDKLEGVVDAEADAQLVKRESLQQADATGEEIEPRPLKQKVMFALLGVGLLVGLVFGVIYLTRSRTTNKEDLLMTEAQGEFEKASEGLPKDELPLFTAVLSTASGEHAVRHNDKDKLKFAMNQFAKAREDLRPGTTPTRNAVCAELAVALLVMGGGEEQAREQIRLRWVPEVGLKTRPNERVYTVYEELQKTLTLVAGADPEFRNHLARRLTRELVARGQAKIADELIPLALFSQAEQAEGKAIVALEMYRVDKGSDVARRIAEELKARGAELTKANAPSASAQTLFLVLNVAKAPVIVPPPPGGGAITDAARYTYTGLRLLENKPDEALAFARRPGRSESQLRALVLYADWAGDPGPALDAALPLVTPTKGKKDSPASPYAVLRLAQIAAAAGKIELAKQFAEQIPDESLKAWAKGDITRLRLATSPKERGEDGWAELPDDLKKLRAGHAWGRLWLARHNTRISGSRSDEVKAVSAWPAPIVPFGKAGVALGLQDK